jgi:hypothetical protein
MADEQWDKITASKAADGERWCEDCGWTKDGNWPTLADRRTLCPPCADLTGYLRCTICGESDFEVLGKPLPTGWACPFCLDNRPVQCIRLGYQYRENKETT